MNNWMPLVRKAGAFSYNEDKTLVQVAPDWVVNFAKLVAASERERCAKVMEEWEDPMHDYKYECDAATAIRNMGDEQDE